MKKILIPLLFLFSAVGMAQFEPLSNLTFDYGKDAQIPGVDAVIIFEKIDTTAQLTYQLPDSSDIAWYYHTASHDSLIPSSAVRSTFTKLDNLRQGCYELRVNGQTSYFYYLVDFSEYQPVITSVWVDDSEDRCRFVRLYAELERPDIAIYDKLNDATHLLSLTPTTTFMWSNETLAKGVGIRQDAPFEDTEYACAPFEDDFFSDGKNLKVKYSSPDTFYSEPYEAVAVGISHFEASLPDGDATLSNTLVNSTTTEGSAPLDITYSVDIQGDFNNVVWWVWKADGEQPSAPTYRQMEQITYKFKTYAPNGYRVKVKVENADCYDLDSTSVMVTESALEVPNVLVLGFGADGMFKVAYKSIEPSSFKAAIYDRSGRLIYKWNDPQGGWDGRSSSNAYVSPGAYYYSIQAEGTDGKAYKLIGDVNVVREKGL